MLVFTYLLEQRAVRVSTAAGAPSTLLETMSENDSSRTGQYRYSLAGMMLVVLCPYFLALLTQQAQLRNHNGCL